MLGGELIHCCYDDDELAKKYVRDALRATSGLP